MVSQKMNFEKEPVIMPFNPKVNVLLSTYNGEKYLALQLKSLLEQTYQNMTIYVRDDGSEDNTRAILEHYRQKESETSTSRIVLVGDEKNPNIGYMESFWTLLRESEPADYYAFCDQDDFWFPLKVELGVKSLESYNSNIPLLYFSSFIYCDENMNPSGNSEAISTPILFKDVMFYTPAFGFTILINHTLRDIALSASSLKDIPHDGWCQKIAASMGKIIYDPTQTAKYRRHSSAVTYANANKKQLLLGWLKNDIFGAGMSEYYFVLNRFWEEYTNRLEGSVRNYLGVFRGQPVTFQIYLKRLFFRERIRPSWGGEIAARICFLLNR
jgi:rhamnosyltransferase